MKPVPRKPTRRDLLVVIGRLQDIVSSAESCHGNDRDPNGFEKGQDLLKRAFRLCVSALGSDPPLEEDKYGPWGDFKP